MAHGDLSAQFQKMCDRANTANARIQAANQRTVAASRPSEASKTADHREEPAADHGQKSERRREIRDKLRGHLAKVREDFQTGKVELDATDAIQNAGMAELSAREAIDSAEDAIEVAEDAVLNALQARAAADVSLSDLKSSG